jgi:hypothetical protein
LKVRNQIDFDGMMRLAYDMVLKFPWISVSPKAKYLVLFAAAIRKKRVSQLSAYPNW